MLTKVAELVQSHDVQGDPDVVFSSSMRLCSQQVARQVSQSLGSMKKHPAARPEKGS